jgi:two-component system response regulator HydG
MKSRLILLVDDDTRLLAVLAGVLRRAGHPAVETLSDPAAVLPFLAGVETALVVLDLNMPGKSGRELLREIKENHPMTPVVMLTAVRDLETAVDCMREGACDYLVKPVQHSRLLAAVASAFEQRRVSVAVSSHDLSPAPERLRHEEEFAGIVTACATMRALFRYVEAIAPTSLPVLITGETGTGKELLARSVHGVSGRKGPFVAINIAGLDDLQFSDSLFGHLRGAYTGADSVREGLTATAAGGTLFLDEIGDLRAESQIKLLRLLQENEFYPLGADSPRRCTARFVVATNHDLEKLVAEGTFRNDLFYRLRAHHVDIPPLRSRAGDLPLLIDRFIADAARTLGQKKPYHPPELVTLLGSYGFPGNVRELQMMVFDAVARTTSGKLSLDAFKQYLGRSGGAAPIPPQSGENHAGITFDHFPTLVEAESYLIAKALELAKGNQGIAASMLGVSRQALNNRLRSERRKKTITDP